MQESQPRHRARRNTTQPTANFAVLPDLRAASVARDSREALAIAAQENLLSHCHFVLHVPKATGTNIDENIVRRWRPCFCRHWRTFAKQKPPGYDSR